MATQPFELFFFGRHPIWIRNKNWWSGFLLQKRNPLAWAWKSWKSWNNNYQKIHLKMQLSGKKQFFVSEDFIIFRFHIQLWFSGFIFNYENKHQKYPGRFLWLWLVKFPVVFSAKAVTCDLPSFVSWAWICREKAWCLWGGTRFFPLESPFGYIFIYILNWHAL